MTDWTNSGVLIIAILNVIVATANVVIAIINIHISKRNRRASRWLRNSASLADIHAEANR